MTGRHPELDGRVAVVTGGGKGIGRGIARRLTREGMRVAAVDVDEAALADTVDELASIGHEPLALVADVSDRDAIDDVFRSVAGALGDLHLLVNNAAVLERRLPLDDHPELLDLQLATNIRGPYLCSQNAARMMVASGGGTIVNISSVGASRAHHRGVPYDVTKGAVNAMTMAMAVDLGQHGIRVNAIAPGVTRTYRTEPHVGSANYVATESRIPMRRFGTVDDIAAAVAFLASDDSSYITGQVLHVDGGITSQLSPPGPGALEPEGNDEPAPRSSTPTLVKSDHP